MRVLKFLVQIDLNARTRCFGDVPTLQHALEVTAASLVNTMTEGPEPRVSVIRDETQLDWSHTQPKEINGR